MPDIKLPYFSSQGKNNEAQEGSDRWVRDDRSRKELSRYCVVEIVLHFENSILTEANIYGKMHFTEQRIFRNPTICYTPEDVIRSLGCTIRSRSHTMNRHVKLAQEGKNNWYHNYTTDEIIERIAKACREMKGDDLATLANKEFGMEIVYNEDDVFLEIKSGPSQINRADLACEDAE